MSEQIRSWLWRLGIGSDPDVPRAMRPERVAYRIATARRQFPLAMTVAAVILVVLGLLVGPRMGNDLALPGVSFYISAGILLVYGLLIPLLSDAVVLWGYGVVMALVLAPWLVRAELSGSPALLGFSAVLAMMLVSLAMSWKPVIVGFILLTAFDLIVGSAIEGPSAGAGMQAVVVAAQLFAAGVLIARIQTMNRAADAAAAAARMATEDHLTGLLNRHGLELSLATLEGTARRAGVSIFVGYVDVDGLKRVNDGYGHEEGDRVIKAVGQALRDTLRAGDLAARVGGDEFLIVGVGGPVEAGALAARLEDSIRSRYQDTEKWPATVTVGVASGPANERTVADLMNEADAAMYAERRRLR